MPDNISLISYRIKNKRGYRDSSNPLELLDDDNLVINSDGYNAHKPVILNDK